MKKSTCCMFAVLLFAFSARGLFAGAWTQKRGAGYYKIGFRFIRADQYYEPDGSKVGIPTFGDYTVSFYGEYGLSERITLVASVPFFKRLILNRQVGDNSGFVFFEGDEKSGFADSDIGVRVGLLKSEGAVLSTELLFGLPIGDDSQTNGLLTGDGELNQLFKLQFGFSFYPKSLYFTSEIGYNNRTEGYSDEFRYSAEMGYTIRDRFLIIMRVLGTESLKNGDDIVFGGMGGSFANNQSFLSYGTEINYVINNILGISAGIEGATKAENALSALTYSFGVYLKR